MSRYTSKCISSLFAYFRFSLETNKFEVPKQVSNNIFNKIGHSFNYTYTAIGHPILACSRLFLITSFQYTVRMLNAPAAERNKDHILNVLKSCLPEKPSKALEVASGTGQHVAHFAENLPHVSWVPSDIEKAHLNSISAHTKARNLTNISDPIHLNMMEEPSPLAAYPALEPKSFDLIYNANMVHISPWGTAEGLFYTAGRLLKPNGVLFMYGPFKIDGNLTPESNIRFDAGLMRQDPSWGVRDTEDLKQLGSKNGLVYQNMMDMPANNKCLIFKKSE